MSAFTSTAAVPARTYSHPLTPTDREALILEHLWHVRLIARSIWDQVPGLLSFEDLVSSGTLGLIAAIDRFDPSHGVKLRTYAEIKIRGAILDGLRELDWAPRSRRRRARALVAATENAEKRTHNAASVQDIADEIGITVEECHRWMRDARQITFESLDLISSDSEGGTISRQIPASGADAEPDRGLEHQQLRALLARTIERMPSQERLVLSLLFHDDLSVGEVASVLGVHNSRVSQIKAQALRRMREVMAENWPRKGAAHAAVR